MSLRNDLQYQLSLPEYSNDAIDCITLYEHLERTTGHVWDGQWTTLVATRFIGTYPNSRRISTPTSLGRAVLNGLNTTH